MTDGAPPRMDTRVLRELVGRGTPAEIAWAVECLGIYLTRQNRENDALRAALRPLAEHEAVDTNMAEVCAFCNADGSHDFAPARPVEHDAGCAVLAARAALGAEEA